MRLTGKPVRLKIFTALRGWLSAPVLALLAMAPAEAAVPQSVIDQADPSVVHEELRRPERRDLPRPPRPIIEEGGVANAQLSANILVGAIRVEGAEAIAASSYAPVIDAFVGRELSPEDLRALASAIANVARQRGYGLATAWVPQQQVTNGILRVIIDEGRIDEVRASGAGAAQIQRRLAILATGKPIKTAQLERQLLLAGDIAGIRIGKARLQRIAGRNVLAVNSRREHVEVRAYLDNWGLDAVGPVRLRLVADLNGVIAGDDRLTVGGMVTPLQPREFGLVSLGYAKDLGTGGTQVTFNGYYAKTRPSGALKNRDVVARNGFVSAGVSHPFIRGRAASLWAYLEFSVFDASHSQNEVTFRDDRISSLAASLYGVTRWGKNRLRSRIGVTQGMNLFGATRRGDPKVSRRDADGTFTAMEFWTAYDRPLSTKFSVELQAQGQVSLQPLLASEELGLGGRYFLRGYDYREAAGDEGIAGSAELRYDLGKQLAARDAELYIFADAGKVRNRNQGFGSGSLASAGGGVRLWLGKHLETGLELGFPLRDGPVRGAGEPRVSVTVAGRF